MENLNGNGAVRVKFGPKPTQDMPVEWAAHMLWELRESQPKRFGDLLREAAITGGK